jgi:hypothetical protein
MNVGEIVNHLHLQVRSGANMLQAEVYGGYVGDLLSDVMANSKEGDIWITRQVHQNIVAVASLKEHAGIILIQGCEPAEDTILKAEKENIPILVSELPGFEVIGKVYNLISAKKADPTS